MRGFEPRLPVLETVVLPLTLHPYGGETGIRTLEGLAPLLVFKTSAFNHSAISPFGDSGRIRTLDPRLRRPLLYPAELRSQVLLLLCNTIKCVVQIISLRNKTFRPKIIHIFKVVFHQIRSQCVNMLSVMPRTPIFLIKMR